jgi:hypothetical protein
MKHKVLGYVVLAFVIFFIAKNPSGAAATTGHIGGWLADLATSVGTYLSALTGSGRS